MLEKGLKNTIFLLDWTARMWYDECTSFVGLFFCAHFSKRRLYEREANNGGAET